MGSLHFIIDSCVFATSGDTVRILDMPIFTFIIKDAFIYLKLATYQSDCFFTLLHVSLQYCSLVLLLQKQALGWGLVLMINSAPDS